MNLLADIPTALPEELVQILLQTSSIRVERIISHGHSSALGFWYDQPENEWVLLVAGAARLQFEDEVIELKPGSFVNIPAHRRHRVEWTNPLEPTIWLAIHYPAV
jgi:cupin 2 domain-containing protein